MTALQILRIPILPAGMVNSHLIAGPDGSILVGAGLPGSEQKIEKTLKGQRRSFKDINAQSGLSRRNRQPRYVRQHAGKQPPRQMTLRQEHR